MKEPATIADYILAWYHRHRRDLPWRQTRNPYDIWVSEIMLQQTRVETVIPYYHRFLSQFPTIRALAEADLQDVLKAWENMGYYSRARHLHLAARKIMDQFEGEIPETLEGLISLPGVGSYTAAAILSIAYGERVPAVDGNVRRVVCRLFLIRDAIDLSGTRRRIHEIAERMVPIEAPGSFNQALMDLGATICTPRKPSCAGCPVHSLCKAYRRGCQETLPVAKKRGPLPHRHVTAAIIADKMGRFLIVQRPPRGLLGGLWKFPGGMKEPAETPEEALKRSVYEETGVQVMVKRELIAVKHAYTHFRITLRAYHCARLSGKPRPLGCAHWRWAGHRDFSQFPLSKADRKIIDVLDYDP